ncbi:hypothetical protein BaRGS_00022122 [Batillaria attramentaria]|uniref:Uncharacterized protein n=1 Tax=Batillaria attramentaria TaxID=370345 RepID=A0ABD0KHR9_9CAEN
MTVAFVHTICHKQSTVVSSQKNELVSKICSRNTPAIENRRPCVLHRDVLRDLPNRGRARVVVTVKLLFPVFYSDLHLHKIHVTSVRGTADACLVKLLMSS